MPLTDSEINALIVLLSDPDPEILSHVEKQLLTLNVEDLPRLELAWQNSIDPEVQVRLERIMHQLQFKKLSIELKNWYQTGKQNLLEGLTLISKYKYPGTTTEKISAKIEQLVEEIKYDFELSEDNIVNVKNLNQHFFKRLGFKPNTANFHSVDNSMINQVIQSRRGNPISLCCIYMLIGNALGIPLQGVNMPNLFILLYKTNTRVIYINVFNRGVIFTRADIDNYINRLNMTPLPLFYEACSSLDIIQRSLRNLVLAYQKENDSEKLNEIQELLSIVSGK